MFVAYGAAKYAAETTPVTWPVAFGALFLQAVAVAIAVSPFTSGRALLLSMAAWFVSLLISANVGTWKLEAARKRSAQ
jgi:hypothetical protein